MVTGSDQARAIAKDYANAERLARWQWTRFDEILRKNFDQSQRRAMWEAADEEDLERQREASDPDHVRPEGVGLDRLTPAERNAVSGARITSDSRIPVRRAM
jgi:hypothetical protein